MVMLATDDQRIEAPAPELYLLLIGSVINTLRGWGMNQQEAERVGMRALTRFEQRLAAAGYIVRQINADVDDQDQDQDP